MTAGRTVLAAAVLLLMGAAIAAGIPGEAAADQDILSITYISMGGAGDATLIQTPDGSNILVDAGDRFGSRYQEVKSVLEQNDVDVVHLAIATHGDADHIGGFNHLLEDADYMVNEVWFMDTAKDTKTVETFLGLSAGVRTQVTAGHAADFADVTMEVLSPPARGISGDENANSIVSLLEYGGMRFLFTGDATAATESWLMSNVPADRLDVDIMNAPHHGSIKTSNTEAFIMAASPGLVVFSADMDNRYGHPHDETRDRYTSNGIDHLQTGISGHINIRTDGTKCSIIFVNGMEEACIEGMLKMSEEQSAMPEEPPKQEEDIPDWVRNLAGWWAEGLVSDAEYAGSLSYLIAEGVIKVPATGLACE